MTRTAGLLLLAVLVAGPSFAADKPPPPPPKKEAKEDPPPPPPPPPPPEEERGTPAIENPSSGSWDIKGQNGLLDKGTGHVRVPMLSFFLGVPWGVYYGGFYYSSFNFSLGGRFYLPIFKEGFLPMLNDSLGVEFGADITLGLPAFGYSAVGIGFNVPAEVRWNFHLFPKLEVYAKAGVGLGMLVSPYVYGYPVIVAQVGALFKLSESFYVRAEVGSPAARVGIGFAF